MTSNEAFPGFAGSTQLKTSCAQVLKCTRSSDRAHAAKVQNRALLRPTDRNSELTATATLVPRAQVASVQHRYRITQRAVGISAPHYLLGSDSGQATNSSLTASTMELKARTMFLGAKPQSLMPQKGALMTCKRVLGAHYTECIARSPKKHIGIVLVITFPLQTRSKHPSLNPKRTLNPKP